MFKHVVPRFRKCVNIILETILHAKQKLRFLTSRLSGALSHVDVDTVRSSFRLDKMRCSMAKQDRRCAFVQCSTLCPRDPSAARDWLNEAET
jgi:hypothetical protein